MPPKKFFLFIAQYCYICVIFPTAFINASFWLFCCVSGWGHGTTARRWWGWHGRCDLAATPQFMSLAGGGWPACHGRSDPGLETGCGPHLRPLPGLLPSIFYLPQTQCWTGEIWRLWEATLWSRMLLWQEGRLDCVLLFFSFILSVCCVI